MIKLQCYLARLIAPLLLVQTLSLQAQSTSVSPSTEKPLSTELCEYLSPQSMGVDRQISLYSDLIYNRQCIILKANPTENLNKLVERIPENTVILLSSETVPTPTPSLVTSSVSASASVYAPTPANISFPADASVNTNTTSNPVVQSNSTTAMPSSSASSVPVKTPVEYFIDDEIRLKDGQDIIGAADEGYEIIIRDRPGYMVRYMVRVGAPDNFRFGERRSSNIRHVIFSPTRENNFPSVESIIYAECYNRRLILEENVFHIPSRAAVNLDCKEPLNLSVFYWHRGPSLEFANNTIIGKKYTTLQRRLIADVIPDQGILINLPAIRNKSGLLAVIGNTFRGDMAEAGEFRLGPKASMDVFKNTVDISNDGITNLDPVRKGGFVFVGTTENETRFPLFYLIGNQIKTTQTALTISGQVALNLVCNHLQAIRPWWQPLERFSLIAAHITLDDMTKQRLCEKVMSSPDVWPIPTQTTVNIWTAINDSPATACTGLVNLLGQFFFATEVCQKVNTFSGFIAGSNAFLDASNISTVVTTHSSSTTSLSNSSSTISLPTPSSINTTVVPTSSARRAAVTSAIGVITTLAILSSL